MVQKTYKRIITQKHIVQKIKSKNVFQISKTDGLFQTKQNKTKQNKKFIHVQIKTKQNKNKSPSNQNKTKQKFIHLQIKIGDVCQNITNQTIQKQQKTKAKQIK